MSRPTNPLIVAADVSEPERALGLASALHGLVAMLKLGLEYFTAAGPDGVTGVRERVPVFLDLKLHDIPTTVGRAARNAARLGVSMLTVHALGGPEMVAAAVTGATEGAKERGVEPPVVVAVTVLSSLAEQAGSSPATLAFEAISAGAGGVVVSGDDVRDVRDVLGEDPILVVPGIRPSGYRTNDHARILTPAEALDAGADYLVVGRPVTEAADPADAAKEILRETRR